MQTNQGKKLDQKRAQEGLQISPLNKLDRMTMVNTGMDVTRAQTGKIYDVTKDAVLPSKSRGQQQINKQTYT